MIRFRGPLLVLAAALLVALPARVSADELGDQFKRGVELLNRGLEDQALAAFQEALASDPSGESAYELWKETAPSVWVDLLSRQGQFEVVAKRLIDLARLGRLEVQNDADAIRELLRQLNDENVQTRLRVTAQLASEHGAYAVPQLLHVLADQGDTDRRVIFMQALTRMGDQVVPPLIEAMQSPDPFQRRNVALTLGYIGDPRANGVLALHANDDPDTGAREAATEALSRTGGSRDALAQLLALGDDYYRQSDRVLMPHQVSDVIWLWRDRALESVVVPSYLYKDEMAKMSYLRALDAAPGSAEALAGIARAVVSEQATLEELVAAGEDGAEEWSQRLAEDVLALHAVGPGPVDVALGWSLDQGDQAGARGLARALAGLSLQPTANLGRAVREVGSGAVRGEAAIALGEIAYAANASAPPEVVQALAQAAGRDIARIAAVIDADDARRTSLASALEGRGMTVNSWKTAGRALAGLHSIPGVDVVVVADTLPDLTVGQVIADIRRDPRLAAAPILVVSGETERATELYGELATGVIGPDDVDAVEAATAEHLNRDREEANRLAARAADTLRRLAEAGHSDVGPATDALAGTLAARPDEVTIPAMHALAHDGGPRHAMACLAVLTDAERSDEARVASAEALAGIFARDPQAGHESAQALREVATSTDAAFAIRAAASKALGRLSLPPDQRSELVRAVRARLAPEGSATADATE